MESFIATVMMFGFNFAPVGWLFCNGATLPINQYQALFSLLGTTYGGDGRTTFHLPDLRGKSSLDSSPTDCHYCICVEGVYPQRP